MVETYRHWEFSWALRVSKCIRNTDNLVGLQILCSSVMQTVKKKSCTFIKIKYISLAISTAVRPDLRTNICKGRNQPQTQATKSPYNFHSNIQWILAGRGREYCNLLETFLPDNGFLRFLSLDHLFYNSAAIMSGLQPHIPSWWLDLKIGRTTPNMRRFWRLLKKIKKKTCLVCCRHSKISNHKSTAFRC